MSSGLPSLFTALELILPPSTQQLPSDEIIARARPSSGGLRIALETPGTEPPVEDRFLDEISAASNHPDLPLRRSGEAAWKDEDGRLVLRRVGSSEWDVLDGSDPLLPALIIWHRMLRLIPDAIFFHASTVSSPDARGVMFIGPKGAGKSTTALALSNAEGWKLLGDETAWYRPETHQIGPFLRPVGIKPGKRSMAVARSLLLARIDPDISGPLRLPPATVTPRSAREPVRLDSIVFLRGFATEPSMIRVSGTSEYLAELQPVISSMLNESKRTRSFQLARMLSRSKLYELHPGEPDATAQIIRRIYQ